MSKLKINSTLRMNSGYEIPMLGYGSRRYNRRGCGEVFCGWLQTRKSHSPIFTSRSNNSRSTQQSCIKTKNPQQQQSRKAPFPALRSSSLPKIPPRTLSYENAKAQIDASLKLTGFDYIDLMLLHAPFGGRENRKGAWKALVEAQEAGKIRSIGVSNYGVHHLDELEVYIKELEKERGGAGKGGKVDVGQWEIHPWLPRKDITEWCKKRGIVVEAYCPIVRSKRADDPALQPLMKKHGKTSTQILIRWSLQKGYVPLPKSVTPSRIVENADVYDFELDAEDMKALDIDSYAPCAWDPTVSKLEE